MLGFLIVVPAKLKTILDRFSSARATKLDYLSAALTSRISASTLTSIGSVVSGLLSKIDVSVTTRAGGIRQIFNGDVSYSYSTGTWSNDILSSIVNVEKCILFNCGYNETIRTSFNSYNYGISFDKTTKTVYGSGGGDMSVSVRYMLVEFY